MRWKDSRCNHLRTGNQIMTNLSSIDIVLLFAVFVFSMGVASYNITEAQSVDPIDENGWCVRCQDTGCLFGAFGFTECQEKFGSWCENEGGDFCTVDVQ